VDSQRPKRYSRIAKACERIGVSKPTFYRYVRDVPDFPKIIKLSERVSVIDDEELEAWATRRRAAA
jgi:predicted DNA-binding transcriptional regulator AlpA